MKESVKATIIRPNQAIKLRARKECVDREGHARVTGEEWIVKKTGAYLPGAYEEVVDTVNAFVLTEKVQEKLSEFQNWISADTWLFSPFKFLISDQDI